MSGGNGTKIIAIIAVIAILGAFYFWYTGTGISLGGGGARYQGLTPISAGYSGGGGGGSSGKGGGLFDGIGGLLSAMMMPGLLGGLGAAGIGIFSKLRYGEWKPWNIRKNVLKLNADKTILVPAEGEDETTITATVNKGALANSPIEITICEKGAASGAKISEMGGYSFEGRDSLTLNLKEGCNSASAILRVQDRENTHVKICARVKMLGLGKMPHDCVMVTILKEKPKKKEEKQVVAPDKGPTEKIEPDKTPERIRTLNVTTEPNAGEYFMRPGTQLKISAKITEETAGNPAATVEGARVFFNYNTGNGRLDVHNNTSSENPATATLHICKGRHVVSVEGEGVNNNNGVEIKVWGGEKPNLKEINEKLDRMETQIGGLKLDADAIKEINGKVTELKEATKDMSGKMGGIADKVGKLDEKLDNLIKKDIAEMKKQIAELHAKFNPEAMKKIQEGIASLQEYAKTLAGKKDIDNLEKTIDDVSAQFHHALEEKANEINKKLDELQKQAGGADKETLEKISGQIAELLEQQEAIEEQLKGLAKKEDVQALDEDVKGVKEEVKNLALEQSKMREEISKKIGGLDERVDKVLEEVGNARGDISELDKSLQGKMGDIQKDYARLCIELAEKIKTLEGATAESTRTAVSAIRRIEERISKLTRERHKPTKQAKTEIEEIIILLMPLLRGTQRGEKLSAALETYMQQLKKSKKTLLELQFDLTRIMMQAMIIIERSKGYHNLKPLLEIEKKKMLLDYKKEFAEKIIRGELKAKLEVAADIHARKVGVDIKNPEDLIYSAKEGNGVKLNAYLVEQDERATVASPLGIGFESVELLEATERGHRPLTGPKKIEAPKENPRQKMPGGYFTPSVNATTHQRTYVAFFAYNYDRLIEQIGEEKVRKKLRHSGIYSNKVTIEKA